MCDTGAVSQAKSVGRAVQEANGPFSGVDLTQRFSNKPREMQLPSARNFTPVGELSHINTFSASSVSDVTRAVYL